MVAGVSEFVFGEPDNTLEVRELAKDWIRYRFANGSEPTRQDQLDIDRARGKHQATAMLREACEQIRSDSSVPDGEVDERIDQLIEDWTRRAEKWLAGECRHPVLYAPKKIAPSKPRKQDLKKAAERYIDLGWPVVPVNGKVPIGDAWQHKAVSDRTSIDRALTGDSIGVLLGPSSGLVDVECDSPEAESRLIELIGDIVTLVFRVRGESTIYSDGTQNGQSQIKLFLYWTG